MAISFRHTTPIFRIFSLERAREFYCGFLGFKVDWEHRFDDRAPLFMQVSRDALVFFLSEHHGDGSPGIKVYVDMTGIEDFHREIAAKNYGFMRPGLEQADWGGTELAVIDPFGNRIVFSERRAAAAN